MSDGAGVLRQVLHQVEVLGRWVQSVRLAGDQLTTVQQRMYEQILGIEPATEDETETAPHADRQMGHELPTRPPSSFTSANDTFRSRGNMSNGSPAKARKNQPRKLGA